MKRYVDLLSLLALIAVVASCDREAPLRAAQRQDPDADTRDRMEQQLGDIPQVLDTASAARLSAAFRAAAAQALPAVVHIKTIAVDRGGMLPFHPAVENGERLTQAAGSGFVIDERGHILTNHHVIDHAVTVSVALLDGREFSAEIVGGDPSTDVAVIRVDAGSAQLPAIALGDSDQLRVGDWVIALGNPLGLTFTATAGIVSAKGRSINILDPANRASALESFIQTDAAINPGNSGGPLVDLSGRVVGINTAIQSETGTFTGAGFAIPITLARKVAADLIEHGVVHRPRLGITIQTVSPADAEVYGLSSVSGVEVTSVTPGDAADRAGLQLGDVITAINGQAVNSVPELQARVALFQPGDRIELEFTRYGKPLRASVSLGEFEPARPQQVRDRPQRSSNPLGFTVTPLPANVARRLRLQGDNLPIVSDIDQFGPAFDSGLQPYHIIRRFNNREIRSMADLERAAREVRPGQVVSLIVINARVAQPLPTIVNFRLH